MIDSDTAIRAAREAATARGYSSEDLVAEATEAHVVRVLSDPKYPSAGRSAAVSYDLSFWRQTSSVVGSPLEVYEQLNRGDTVPGLVPLPTDTIVGAVHRLFPDADRTAESLSWIDHDHGKSIHVTWSSQHVRVDLRPLEEQEDNANRIIDCLFEFGCALYDPQTDERFEQPAGADVSKFDTGLVVQTGDLVAMVWVADDD